MVRWLSIAVITYMILGITWWGVLLYQKNQELYEEKQRSSSDTEMVSIKSDKSRQNLMIIGEGVVLGCSLLLGIYIINRSAQKEIQGATQQNNFLLSVSHELKSPIAAIKLALQTLKRPGLTEHKKEEFVSSAINDTSRLEKMVQNVLLSASMEASSFELLKSAFSYTDMLQDVRSQHRENVNFTGLSDDIKGHGDPTYLKQAITNILDNAVKYGDFLNAPVVSLSNEGEQIVISIKNSGAPIKRSDQTRIFEKFYRAKDDVVRAKEGTGLGLYLAHEIVKAHHGTIKVSSTDGWNRFDVIIPQHVG